MRIVVPKDPNPLAARTAALAGPGGPNPHGAPPRRIVKAVTQRNDSPWRVIGNDKRKPDKAGNRIVGRQQEAFQGPRRALL